MQQDVEARDACVISERGTEDHPFERTMNARNTNIVSFRQTAYAIEGQMKPTRLHLSTPAVAQRILFVRGHKVMVDADLAELYGVPTKRLNEQVKRNIERFPADFMFRLSAAEKARVVANCDHLHKLKFSPGLPFVFTEHGALMLGNVLKSPRAVQVSLLIVRTFVQLRELLATHRELAAKLNEHERKVSRHGKALAGVIDAIRQLMRTPTSPSGWRSGLHSSGAWCSAHISPKRRAPARRHGRRQLSLRYKGSPPYPRPTHARSRPT